MMIKKTLKKMKRNEVINIEVTSMKIKTWMNVVVIIKFHDAFLKLLMWKEKEIVMEIQNRMKTQVLQDLMFKQIMKNIMKRFFPQQNKLASIWIFFRTQLIKKIDWHWKNSWNCKKWSNFVFNKFGSIICDVDTQNKNDFKCQRSKRNHHRIDSKEHSTSFQIENLTSHVIAHNDSN